MKNELVSRKEHMELVDQIKVEFNRIDDRFDRLSNQMAEGFEEIKKCLSYHDARFNDLEKRLSEKVDKKDFKILITVLKAGNVINRHEADHFLIPVQ